MSVRRAVASVLTLLAGLGTLGALGATTLPHEPDLPVLPPDGLVAQAAWLQGGTVQVEQALMPAIGLGSALGSAVLGSVEPSTRTLRATFTPDAPGDAVVLTVENDHLVLQGFSLDGDGRYIEGGIPLVDGAQVSGKAHIAAVSSTPFTAAVTLAGSGDCEDVTIALETELAGAETIAMTLCDGRGLTAFRADLDGAAASGFAVDGTPVPFAETTLQVDDRAWSDAASWQPAAYVPTASDAFGSATGPYAAAGLIGAPAALHNGTVAVVDEFADDVVVFGAGRDGVADLRWRGHPGGQLVAVTTVGDMVIAVRAGGSLVAYSVDGVRIWENDAATESVVGSFVTATGFLAFATLDGVVWLLDAATGEVVWQRDVADRLTRGVVGDARVIFAFDREGTLFGFTYDGEQPLYGDVASAFQAVALDDDHTYLGRSAAVESYSIWDSTYLWATDVPGSVVSVCSRQDQVAVVATRGTVLLDVVDGRITRLDDRVADAIECGRGAAVLAFGDTVEIWSATGSDVSLQMPAQVADLVFRGVAPAADGVWVVSEDSFVWWGA